MASPADRISPDVARAIRLVILDVDGVLTDGGLYIGAEPRGRTIELKRFHVQDGLGVKMLRWAGIEVVIVSGRVSEATARRAQELGVTECHQDPGAAKLPLVRELLGERDVGWEEVAMMGDDLADLPVLERVGLAVSVPNAVAEVRQAAGWSTRAGGGAGAVREFAEALLMARGQWRGLVQGYLDARSGS